MRNCFKYKVLCVFRMVSKQQGKSVSHETLVAKEKRIESERNRRVYMKQIGCVKRKQFARPYDSKKYRYRDCAVPNAFGAKMKTAVSMEEKAASRTAPEDASLELFAS